MSPPRLDRWLLVNYAGYPYSPNSLIPDNGLASLAGCLLAAGRRVQILDFSTVIGLRAHTSPALCEKLTAVWSSHIRAKGRLRSKVGQFGMLATLWQCDRKRDRHSEEVVRRITDDLVARIRREGIDAVGFKLWNGDGLEGSVAMARQIRRQCPGVRLFAGGPHVDVFMENLLPYCECFDALAYGDGEETILRLAEEGSDPTGYAQIPNLIYADHGKTRRTAKRSVANLDNLPMPAYDTHTYPSLAGDDKLRIFVIDESRGCQNTCAFCIHPVKSGHSQRLKSIPRLIDEIRFLQEHTGVSAFRFAGSSTPYTLLAGFAKEVLRRGMRLIYTSFAHIRGSEAVDFERLRQSGCLSLFIGVESGSSRILASMRKGVGPDLIAHTIREAKAAGIFTVASLIFPAPGEDVDSEASTLDLLKQARPDALTVQAPIVAPRTDWFENPEAYGITFPSREGYLRAGTRYKVSSILPPVFWKPLPVRIDGRRYRDVLRETGRFMRLAEGMGITTSVSDDTYLMSFKAGMDAADFRDQSQRAFFAGDAEAVAALARRINSGAPAA